VDWNIIDLTKARENDRIIVGSIIRLADQLGMMTLTEGVETEEAVEYLKQGGCGRLQGYYYGKPMPYDDILDRIEKGEYRISDTLA
jgi:EAL domain-containing protein (putative c-di-GMP-specific phosphodiesterase class I)